MGKPIKKLYGGMNMHILPNGVKNFFESMSDKESKWSQVFMHCGNWGIIRKGYEADIYILTKHYRVAEKSIRETIFLNKNLKLIEKEKMYLYLGKYAKGFYEGYNDFEDRFKSDNTVLKLKHDDIIKKIFLRATFKYLRYSGRMGVSPALMTKDHKLYIKYCGKDISILHKHELYDEGWEGGEFYKAWEMIFDKPMLFEHLFNKQSKLEDISIPLIENKESDLPKWFPIGLGFASGEIRKKLKIMSANEIVKEYSLKNYQNYITSTGIGESKDPKNIYSDLKKLKIIFNYCTKYDINMCAEFKEAYQTKLDETI